MFLNNTKNIYQQIGESHYIYNELRWIIVEIGWWHYKIDSPKTFGERWKLFGKWMDSKFPGHERYMNTGEILKTVVKNDYICELYKHIVKMRGLFTHFFCDDDLYRVIRNRHYDPNDGIAVLPIISCGKDGIPEKIDELFIFTFSYYCVTLYNKLADFIQKNINPNYDEFRFNLNLTQNGVTRKVHPRWNFEKIYNNENQK